MDPVVPEVLHPQTPPIQPTFFQKHDVFFLMLFASIVGLILLVGIIFLSLQITIPEDEPTQAKTSERGLPSLAYIEKSGIALPENNNPDLGKLFVVNPQNGSKKALTNFSKEELEYVYDEPIYSPLTKEILVMTNYAILAVSTSTGTQRTLYTFKPKHEGNMQLSFDKQQLFIEDYEEKVERQTYNTSYYQLSLKETIPTAKKVNESVMTERSPFRTTFSKKQVDVAVKSSHMVEVGRIVSSSTFTVTDLTTKQKREFIYEKTGEIEPLFQSNDYFYFKVNQCCASTGFLNDMQQLDLTSGEFGSPSSVPEIYAHINDKEQHIEDKGVSPDGRYFAYVVDLAGYIYDTEKKKEIPLNAIISDHGNPTWSTDSKYLLHTGFTEEDTYIYNTVTKKLSHLSIPKDQNYLILQ